MQLASMSLDLRSRQQQVDAMRGELQKAGTRLAAERQQADQQAAMLMEQLAIAQATSADTKVHMQPCQPCNVKQFSCSLLKTSWRLQARVLCSGCHSTRSD